MARFAGSKTWIISCSAQLTKTLIGDPAKTTSEGSFSVVTLRTVAFKARSTMLMSSLMVFTTHTSLLVRARTVTGSMPTGMLALCKSPVAVMLKTSSVLFAVFTASNFVPSGVFSIGCTWADSKFTKSLSGTADLAPPMEAVRPGSMVADRPTMAPMVTSAIAVRWNVLAMDSSISSALPHRRVGSDG